MMFINGNEENSIITAIINRSGANDDKSPLYGKPSGVRISTPIVIKNIPINTLRTLSAFLIKSTNGN